MSIYLLLVQIAFAVVGVVAGGYIGWEVFLWSGDFFPAFGHFPVGFILGITIFGGILGLFRLIGAYIAGFFLAEAGEKQKQSGGSIYPQKHQEFIKAQINRMQSGDLQDDQDFIARIDPDDVSDADVGLLVRVKSIKNADREGIGLLKYEHQPEDNNYSPELEILNKPFE